MLYKDVSCDIYIGKGAGRNLLKDIRNAKKSVKIVSPYLSPFLVSELIDLRKRKLEVELITTDNIEDFYGGYEKNIHKLIIQHRNTDRLALKERESWKNLTQILTYVGIGLLIVLVGTIYYLQDLSVALGLVPVSVIFMVIKFYRDKIKNKQIYTYWYDQLFPFKVYKSPNIKEENSVFIHSKIYLIDDQIAYLGSFNFTSSGVRHNYETSIKVKDPEAIQEVKKEIYQLMNHLSIPTKDIQLWGKQLYEEPIN